MTVEDRRRERGRLLRDPLFIAVLSALVLAPLGTLGIMWFTSRGEQAPISAEERQRLDEPGRLDRARPGGSLGDLEQTLGVPPVERNGDGRYQRVVFILPRSAVLAVVDKSDKVLLVSITSLDTDFKPSFTLADGSSVTLGSTTPDDVTAKPVQAMGHVGAHDVYYFEWTYPPVSATNYRQDLYGWAFLVTDEADSSIKAFEPFFTFDTDPRLPGEGTFAPLADRSDLAEWVASAEGIDLRRSLTINTVGFMAANISSLPVFPAALDIEVWPHRSAPMPLESSASAS